MKAKSCSIDICSWVCFHELRWGVWVAREPFSLPSVSSKEAETAWLDTDDREQANFSDVPGNGAYFNKIRIHQRWQRGEDKDVRHIRDPPSDMCR